MPAEDSLTGREDGARPQVPPTGVSVVIPAFNAARFLPETLESVFRQTVPPQEVIVVDDGSTDATPDVMASFRERTTYLRKENGGPSSARNLGTMHARGEWIAYLDADDVWLPQRLERSLALARQTKADFVFSDAAVLEIKEGSASPLVSSWLTDIGRKSEIESGLVGAVMSYPFKSFMEMGCVVLPSTVLVRKKCMEEVGLFDEDLDACEDLDVLLRLAPRCRMAFSPESLIIRRMHGQNLSLTYPAIKLALLRVWEKAAQLDTVKKDPKWQQFVRKKMAPLYIEEAVLCAEKNDATKARATIVKSLKAKFSARATVHWALLQLPLSWANAIRTTVRPLHRKYAAFRESRTAN